MIVCLCKNVNTAQIVQSVRGGARSVDEIRSETGATSCCGKCQFKVNRVLQENIFDEQHAFYDATATA